MLVTLRSWRSGGECVLGYWGGTQLSHEAPKQMGQEGSGPRRTPDRGWAQDRGTRWSLEPEARSLAGSGEDLEGFGPAAAGVGSCQAP